MSDQHRDIYAVIEHDRAVQVRVRGGVMLLEAGEGPDPYCYPLTTVRVWTSPTGQRMLEITVHRESLQHYPQFLLSDNPTFEVTLVEENDEQRFRAIRDRVVSAPLHYRGINVYAGDVITFALLTMPETGQDRGVRQ